jgi:UPF0755 protein
VTDQPNSPPAPRRRRGAREPEFEFEDAYVDPDEDYVPIRVASPLGRRIVNLGVATFVALALVAGFGLVWAMRQVDPPGGQGAPIGNLEVPKGATRDSISALLEKHEVIASATVFQWYISIRGIGAAWRAGTYTDFKKNSSMAEAARVLAAGPLNPQYMAITIPPGVRLVDALDIIHKSFPALTSEVLTKSLQTEVTSKYLGADKNWEGLLAPDTYQFAKNATAKVVLQKLADQQVKVLDGLGYPKAEAMAGRPASDLIKMASLIEKEAGDPVDERGKIARVINNRLDANEPLGIDAALLYGVNKRTGPLTKAEIDQDTPYNNRLHPGLPPTPIALPGKASLQAAIQPPAGPWKWYVLVSKSPAAHLFTDNYDEFLKAKAKAVAEGVF